MGHMLLAGAGAGFIARDLLGFPRLAVAIAWTLGALAAVWRHV
jgi:hypothetical protein